MLWCCGCRREAFISVIGPRLAIGCHMKSRTCHLETNKYPSPHRITNRLVTHRSLRAIRIEFAFRTPSITTAFGAAPLIGISINQSDDMVMAGQIPRVPNVVGMFVYVRFVGHNDSGEQEWPHIDSAQQPLMNTFRCKSAMSACQIGQINRLSSQLKRLHRSRRRQQNGHKWWTPGSAECQMPKFRSNL